MTTAADIVGTARRILQDYDADRWDDAVVLQNVNGARRAAAIAMPQNYTATVDHALVAGSKQTVPADCNEFYGPTNNVNADGSVGAAVSVTQREYLDAFLPGWRTLPAAATQHYMFDERNPRQFEVYPPAAAGALLRLPYARIPADLALIDAVSEDEELLVDALADYAVARCLLEDGASPVNERLALTHLNLFSAVTGADLRNLIKNSPNTANVGGRLPKVATGQ